MAWVSGKLQWVVKTVAHQRVPAPFKPGNHSPACGNGGQSIIRSSTIGNPDSSIKYLEAKRNISVDQMWPMGYWFATPGLHGGLGALQKLALASIANLLFSTISQGKPFTPTEPSEHTKCTLLSYILLICIAYCPASKFYSPFRALLKFHLMYEAFFQWSSPHPLQTNLVSLIIFKIILGDGLIEN